jgi:hypothetical protein
MRLRKGEMWMLETEALKLKMEADTTGNYAITATWDAWAETYVVSLWRATTPDPVLLASVDTQSDFGVHSAISRYNDCLTLWAGDEGRSLELRANVGSLPGHVTPDSGSPS